MLWFSFCSPKKKQQKIRFNAVTECTRTFGYYKVRVSPNSGPLGQNRPSKKTNKSHQQPFFDASKLNLWTRATNRDMHLDPFFSNRISCKYFLSFSRDVDFVDEKIKIKIVFFYFRFKLRRCIKDI